MKQTLPYCLIIVSSLLLSACGFKPMAATNQSGAQTPIAAELASVKVRALTSDDRRMLGQQFRVALEDLIDPSSTHTGSPHYNLNVHLSPLVSPGFIAPDGTAQRFLVNLRSNYELHDLHNNRIIERGSLNRSSSYSNLPNSFFSTYVAEQDTLKRLAEQLAEEYRLKLASLIANPPEKPSIDEFDAPEPPAPIDQPRGAISVPGVR